MEKKIRKNMILLSSLIVVITYICSCFSLYMTMMVSLDHEVKEISLQIKELIQNDENALHTITVFSKSRITLMNQNGIVLYDSFKDSSSLENHLNRPEIQSALLSGTGRSLRFSTSLDTQTYYYAIKLENGNVLRIASETQGLYNVLPSGLVVTGIAMFIVMVTAMYFSKKLTMNIIRPINQIDLNHPLASQPYPELKPLLENLEKHEKMRKEFSANVSHELKTPLTSISGYAEIMANGLVKEDNIRKFSQKIYDESQILFRKIENIIRISRLDEANLPIQIEEVNYEIIIASVLSHLEKQINDKYLTVYSDLQPVAGNGIISVTEEIVYNLIENAVKYSNPNGIIQISLYEDIHHVHIKVQDNGLGIAEEDLPRIYERFYRSDKSHSNSIEGSGLGLSIVKHGLALLGGEISVDSQLGSGTTFHITLKK